MPSFFLNAVAFLLLLLLSAPSAEADEVHLLRFASPYGMNTPFSRADRDWMDRMTRESDGRLQFEAYWNGTLVGRAHTVHELAAGVADIGVISPVVSRAGMHLTRGSLAFYGGIFDRRITEPIFWELWAEHAELREEFAGVVILAANSLSPMFVMTTAKPVRSLDDLRGLRLKSTAEKVVALRRLGVDAVAMPMSEAYFALSRGILDGAVSPADTLISLHFDEMIRYITLLPNPRPPYPSRAINLSVWDRLPDHLRKLMADSAGWWADRIVEEVAVVERRGLERAREIGIEFIEPAPSDMRRYADNLAEEGDRIAQELDARALPGSAMLAQVRDRLEQNAR